MNKVTLNQKAQSHIYIYIYESLKNHLRALHPSYIITGILVSATLMAGAFLSSAKVNADDDSAVDQVSISVPISCTLAGTGMNSHTAEILNGQYSSDIGATTLKAMCNDVGGFAIYAIGFTGDKYDGEDHTKLIGTSTNEKIVTGTATTAGNPDRSEWAMKLATNSSATYPITLDNGYGSYNVVPDTYTKVAHRDGVTDIGESATGTELTTTYAAYISKTQPADTYVGKVKYTLVHPATEDPNRQSQITEAGKICYYPNAGNVEGDVYCQSVSASATSARLYVNRFIRSGYGFAGWSTTHDYSDTAGFRGPNENIFFNAGQYTGNNSGLSLYAYWVKSVGNIQNWDGCAALQQDFPTALTDLRNNVTYAVVKLADNKCWMMENLRIDNTVELTIANTNNPLNNGTSVTLKHNYLDAQVYNTLSVSSSEAYDEDIAPNGWCGFRTTECYDQSRYRTPLSYSYGGYYNWYSATAGKGTYSLGSNVTTTGDLCPAGWRLPIGGNSGELKNLNDIYNNNTNDNNNNWRKFPLNYLFSRMVSEDGSIPSGSELAYYWTGTSYSNIEAYFMIFTGNIVNPGNNHTYKSRGATIRCLTPGM